MNKSSLKTMKILEYISQRDAAPTIGEISGELEIPRSSTRDILLALIESGYIAADGEKTYKVSPQKILGLSGRVIDKLDGYEEVNRGIVELSKEFNETIFFGRAIDDEVVYFNKVDGKKKIRATEDLGNRKPLYHTGLGKALLGTYSDKELEEYIENTQLDPLTEYTITNGEDLKADIDSLRNRGYAIDNREGSKNLMCTAAPVRDHNGVIGAISITGFYGDIDPEELERRGNRVRAVAYSISKSIGFLGGIEELFKADCL